MGLQPPDQVVAELIEAQARPSLPWPLVSVLTEWLWIGRVWEKMPAQQTSSCPEKGHGEGALVHLRSHITVYWLAALACLDKGPL